MKTIMPWSEFFSLFVDTFLLVVFLLIICVMVEEIKKKIKDKKNRKTDF